jgi:UDP-glucose 4-epimerase
MTTYMITGVLGFIGTNLAIRLLERGDTVIGIDKVSRRNEPNHFDLSNYANFKFYSHDLAYNWWPYLPDLPKIDMIFHLASHADIRFSSEIPNRHYESLYMTLNMLDFAREHKIKKIAYASSAAVYGDTTFHNGGIEAIHPTQTSYYGAEKMAGEAFIEAYCESHDAEAWIFRYVSILGERYSHGFVYNFYRELKEHPDHLYVAGSRQQRKCYLYVQDCIDAMLLAIDTKFTALNDYRIRRSEVFNIAHNTTASLPETIPIIVKHMGIPYPDITWSGNRVGWIGDSILSAPDNSKIRACGWNPTLTIPEAIEKTLDWLDANQWILKERDKF